MKVAFCFLVYDTVEHSELWELFFSQDLWNTHRIYAHIKETTEKTQEWIRTNRVRTVKTDWCSEGLIKAFISILRKAIKEDNDFFVLLSGTCIPLRPYYETYRRIVKDPRAKMHYMAEYGNVFEECNELIYNADQWVILNRKVAMDYIKMFSGKEMAKKFLQRMRSLYRDNGVSVGNYKAVVKDDTTWLGGCPDEIYPINWFVSLYGKNLKKYIKNQMTTFVEWDFEKDSSHPTVFDRKTLRKSIKEICENSHIFARKFTKDAVQGFLCMDSPIVKKELVGRLGNQMFQYASMLGIAYRIKGIACISESIHIDDTRRDNEELINVFRGPFLTSCPNIKYTKVSERGYAIYHISDFTRYKNLEIKTTYNEGFLQSWRYFEPVKDIVRSQFQFSHSVREKTRKFIEKIRKDCKVVGIHIRRGDQLSLGVLNFPDSSYFENAKAYFRKKFRRVKFIVATNDRKWSRKEFKNDIIISHTKSAVEDMSILSECDGVIISIGTFGWWGGWLCNGPVVYYKNEFKGTSSRSQISDGVRKKDYYPDYWIGM